MWAIQFSSPQNLYLTDPLIKEIGQRSITAREASEFYDVAEGEYDGEPSLIHIGARASE